MSASVNAEDGTRFDGIDRFRLGNTGRTSVDVANQECSRISVPFAKIIFRFEESGGKSSMRVGVDDRAVGASGVIGTLGDIASRQDRDRSQKMIRVLLFDNAFDVNLSLRLAMRAFEAHTDPPHPAFQK